MAPPVYGTVGEEPEDTSSRAARRRAILGLLSAGLLGLLAAGWSMGWASGARAALERAIIRSELGEDGCIRSASHTYDAPGQVGFVFGATDIYATSLSYRCIAAIETLVRIGGWRGHIYLLTAGAGKCFDAELLRNTTGNPNIHIVDRAYNRMRRAGFKIPKLLGTSSKAFKGLMLDLVGPDGPPILIFHDCDKVVARPGCIVDMFRKPLRFGPERQMLLSNFEPSCIRNEKGRCGDGVHTGVVAVHRNWSLPLVREWARRQLLKPKSYDRNTLWEAWNSSSQPDGTHRWSAGTLNDAFVDRMWNEGNPLACINHVSGGRCRANGPHAARRLMQKLCLRSEYPPECSAERPPKGEFALGWCGGGKSSPVESS